MKLEEILTRLGEIRSELEGLDAAEAIDEDGEKRFAELTAEFETLDESRVKIVARNAALDALRTASEDPRNVISERTVQPVSGATDAPYGMEAVRTVSNVPNTEARKIAMDAVKRDDAIGDADKNRVRELIERDGSGKFARHYVAASSDEYRTGWAKAITGNEFQLTGDEREALGAVRAASLTDGSGGYAVPANLDPTIISTKAADMSPLRQISRQTSITNDVWTGITSAGVTAAYAAEAAEASDNAPTLVQPSISPAKAHAFVPASIEISQDWGSIAADLGVMFAEAKADLEATAFVTGTGSDAPTGIVTALLAASTTTVVDAATASAFNLVDVYNVQEGLPVKHRARASWLANNAIINDIRQFATANNYHGFLTDLAGDTPRQLLGKPLYEASGMDSSVTTDAEILVFGDFSKFLIVDRVGLTVEYIPHLFATANNRPSGQRGWYAYWRNSSGVLDANAFRVLQP